MAEQYTGEIPDELDDTVLDQIETLINYGIIKLSETQARPEEKFDNPGKMEA